MLESGLSMGELGTQEKELKNIDSVDKNKDIASFRLFVITIVIELLWFFILQPLFGFPLSIVCIIPIGYSLLSLSEHNRDR